MTAILQPDRQCKAQTKTGKRCTRWAVHGRDTCPAHGKVNLTAEVAPTGNGKVNQAKAEVAEKAKADLVERLGVEPTEVLRAAVERTDRMARRIEEMLERADIEDREVWPLLRTYREWMTTVADVTKKELDAGVARRRIQLDEARAAAAFAAIGPWAEMWIPEANRQKALHDLGRRLQLA